MTSNTPKPPAQTIREESKATLFGTALVLVMAGLVLAAGAILSVAAVVLGDTALQLP
ncbi:hypothetical protein [Agromyces kandeliae]|uniref:Uncharacterized protein n=1 Tax=Agromyces kandeliae TaxID=2666141 RepID=A0A6L5R3M2_9MICO|nr:hypothetical protein [Agromyces kandeliae]MRX44666.1 hypothetical protein [Agromyces kandeliae]